MKLSTTGKLFSVVAGLSMSAMVSATTGFTPTGGNVNTFDLGAFLPSVPGPFAMFDAGAYPDFAVPMVLQAFDQVAFSVNDATCDWQATKLEGDSLVMGG